MSRSTLSLASATLAALTLAACSDSPLAPSASSQLAPSAAAASNGTITVGGNGTTRPALTVAMTLQVSAQSASWDYVVAGTTYEFSTNAGFKTTVVDNGAGDLDARDGYYKVMLPSAGSYTAKAIALPWRFSFDGADKTGGAFSDATHASLGVIALNYKPALFLKMTLDGAKVLGQSIKITGPNGFSKNVADGGVGDEAYGGGQGPNDGEIIISLPVTGSYYVCPTSTPKTYWDAPCTNVFANYYYVAYAASMNWTQKWFVPQFP